MQLISERDEKNLPVGYQGHSTRPQHVSLSGRSNQRGRHALLTGERKTGHLPHLFRERETGKLPQKQCTEEDRNEYCLGDRSPTVRHQSQMNHQSEGEKQRPNRRLSKVSTTGGRTEPATGFSTKSGSVRPKNTGPPIPCKTLCGGTD